MTVLASNNMTMKKALAILLMTAAGIQVSAQTDTIALEDITISVTPFKERLDEATGSLSIIKLDEQNQQHIINVADELNLAPGVFIGTGTYTTNRVTIRGVGSRTPYSSNRIRAYLDDMPLTNGDGISTIEDLDIAGIARSEILKGPASAVFGSGLGGVILLTPRYPSQQGFSYGITGNYGAFNTWKYGATAGYKNQDHALLGGYTAASSDGFRQNNRYDRKQFFLHGRTSRENDILTYNIIGTDLYAEIPSSLNETDFLSDPTLAAANWLNIEGYEAYRKIAGNISWERAFDERLSNKMTLFGAFSDPYESRPFNILDDQSFMTGLRETLEYDFARFRARAGVELFNEAYQWKIFETNGGNEGAMQLHNTEDRRYINLFAHIKYSPAPRLNIEAGANLNILQYSIATEYQIDGEDQSDSYSYDPIVSPRAGLNYNLFQNHYLHASAGHGFSAPSLEETLLPEGAVNPDLLPETGWNFDLGMRGRLLGETWFYDVTAYTILLSNMLVTERTAEDVFTGINAGMARLSGLEIYNRIKLARSAGGWQTVFSTGIFLNSNRFTEFIDDGTDYSGKELPGIPAQMANAVLSVDYREKLTLRAEARFSGKQFMNDANSLTYDGHMLGNAGVAWKIRPGDSATGFVVTFNVNNIFDTHYASMILVNAPSFGGASPRYYYPGLPRHFSLGVRFGNGLL